MHELLRDTYRSALPQAHRPAALAQQATEAITRLSKGFGQQLCTRQRPEVGELLLGTLETALRAPQVTLSPRPPSSSAAVHSTLMSVHSVSI